MRKGHRLTEEQTAAIVKLLKTDLTMAAIATRMQLSPSIIGRVNRDHNIRRYNGNRISWVSAAS